MRTTSATKITLPSTQHRRLQGEKTVRGWSSSALLREAEVLGVEMAGREYATCTLPRRVLCMTPSGCLPPEGNGGDASTDGEGRAAVACAPGTVDVGVDVLSTGTCDGKAKASIASGAPVVTLPTDEAGIAVLRTAVRLISLRK